LRPIAGGIGQSFPQEVFMIRGSLSSFVAGTLLLSVISTSVLAQNPDPSLAPTYGTKDLKAGFLPDPIVVDVQAGGELQVNLGNVQATVAKAPDFRVNYTKGRFPLTFYVKCDSDTTLLINTPDGKWHANDDTDGANPKIQFTSPMNGQYDIWVGMFGNNKANPAAKLFVTELAPVSETPDVSLPPTYGTKSLKAGFVPDPVEVKVVAGGPLNPNLGGVKAFVAKAPDFRLNYTKGAFALTFYVESAGDTTLLINLPDGTWIANDDTNGLNPQLKFAAPQEGQYDVWVGTLGNATVPAKLFITELK